MAGTLAPLLLPDRITLNVLSTRCTAALFEVARLLDGHPGVTNFQGFFNELLARERIETTCLGNEVALPHARTDHVAGIVMAVGRSIPGVLFENSNQTVRLFFVIGTPKSVTGDYLQVVGALCRIVKDAANREALLHAPTTADFIRILLDIESRMPGHGPALRGA